MRPRLWATPVLECRSSPLDFHGVYVYPTAGGLRVSAKVGSGGGLLQAGSEVFLGANWLDLLILNTGSGVYFQARRTGDANFTLVLGQPTPAGVFSPGIAAYDFGGGPAVSFYDPVLSESSDPAGGNAYEALADVVFKDVIFPLEHAGSLVAGPHPDIPSAASILDGLASGLPSLLPLVTSLPAATQSEQAFASSLARSLSKFTKEIFKAQKAANKGKSPLKSLAKARLLADALIGALRQR